MTLGVTNFDLDLLSPCTLMRAINPTVKRAAVRLVQCGVSIAAAAHLLDISDDTVRHATILFEETGDVVPPPTGKKKGRPPILNQDNKYVS